MLYIIKLNFKIIINLLEMLMELFILFYFIFWEVDGYPLRRIRMNFNLIITL